MMSDPCITSHSRPARHIYSSHNMIWYSNILFFSPHIAHTLSFSTCIISQYTLVKSSKDRFNLPRSINPGQGKELQLKSSLMHRFMQDVLTHPFTQQKAQETIPKHSISIEQTIVFKKFCAVTFLCILKAINSIFRQREGILDCCQQVEPKSFYPFIYCRGDQTHSFTVFPE